MDLTISVRQLQRILHKQGLRRHGNSDIYDIIDAVQN